CARGWDDYGYYSFRYGLDSW
nr:immunoglobulin heavy chain junction region [Macaca mulatta]MOW22312.1 immunoglobulin heavy chain junction region [Macaca mulatta]